GPARRQGVGPGDGRAAAPPRDPALHRGPARRRGPPAGRDRARDDGARRARSGRRRPRAPADDEARQAEEAASSPRGTRRGRRRDIFGRRAVFTSGLALFAAGSLLAGAAGRPEGVIAGRLVQGAGAAAMLPLSLALVNAAFPPDRRAQAVGIWTAISSLALA